MEASPLPLDLLLEIAARSDPATVARCGATCKLLRRHVTGPAFLHRLRSRLASADRFLLGLLYHRWRCCWRREMPATRRQPLFAQPRSSAGPLPEFVVARVSAELDGPCDPVASRGGLLVLRRDRDPSRLCVCNPVTGRRYVLPPKRISDHLHVVMPEDREGNGGLDTPFKLLIANRGLRTQTYSSETGAWGPVTDTPACVPEHYEQVQPCQVVLGGVAHWLYREQSTLLYRVLALDAGTGQAAWIEVPQDCHRPNKVITSKVPQELLLVSSADGELGLLVWERPRLAVCMWTVSADAGSPESGRRWTRRVVIDRATFARSVYPVTSPFACQQIEFEWFAEGSGTVVLQMNCAGIVLLNLRTLEVRRLSRSNPQRFESIPYCNCVYELDLTSLLPSR